MPSVLSLLPENPKFFELRGKPFMLVTATEHYGAVMNRPFNYDRYLRHAAEVGHTLTRLFVLFRELQSYCNPYSTCKPESPDYIAPFPRVGPGTALDGQPKYDLDQWNPEFFERLHGFLGLASELGIVVEVVLTSNTYAPNIWALNPLNAGNNINGLPEIEWHDYTTLRHPRVNEYQLRHIRKVAEETNRYDNILYEICNEPGGWLENEKGLPTTLEVDQWQAGIAKLIRGIEVRLPNQHLISGQMAFTYDNMEQPADHSFASPSIDIVNIHPLPNTTYSGKRYDMGPFMSKQLCLKPFRDFCLASWKENKPLNMDEDNVASQYKDFDGWTIHRKRAWTALLSGAHYDYIDFSIINYCETGSKESRAHIRCWIGHLSRFIHTFDLRRSRPIPDMSPEVPDDFCVCSFGIPGEDLAFYLADSRELGAHGAGEAMQISLEIPISTGDYCISAFSPATGQYSPWLPVSAAGRLKLTTPVFQHDIVIRIRRDGPIGSFRS